MIVEKCLLVKKCSFINIINVVLLIGNEWASLLDIAWHPRTCSHKASIVEFAVHIIRFCSEAPAPMPLPIMSTEYVHVIIFIELGGEIEESTKQLSWSWVSWTQVGDVQLTLSSVSSNQQIVLGVTFVKSHFYENSELNITNIVEISFCRESLQCTEA